MKQIVNGKLVELAPEEISAVQAYHRKAELQEKARPLTAEEVTAMLVAAQINTLDVDDNTALRAKEFYPAWAEGTDYTAAAGRPAGYKVQHGGKLWRLRQEHSSQLNWAPGATGTESLWSEVNETHERPVLHAGLGDLPLHQGHGRPRVP